VKAIRAALTILMLVFVSLPCFASGQDQAVTMKPDYFFKDRLNLYDRDGANVGYVKEDAFFRDQWNVYDESGSKQGYWKWDVFLEEWRYYED